MVRIGGGGRGRRINKRKGRIIMRGGVRVGKQRRRSKKKIASDKIRRKKNEEVKVIHVPLLLLFSVVLILIPFQTCFLFSSLTFFIIYLSSQRLFTQSYFFFLTLLLYPSIRCSLPLVILLLFLSLLLISSPYACSSVQLVFFPVTLPYYSILYPGSSPVL